VATITPVKDTPFETYVAGEVGAQHEAFDALLTRAKDEVAAGRQPSVFVAMERIARAERIDIADFFPQYDVGEVANLEKRNSILLRALLKQSQGRLRFGLDLAGGVSVTFRAKDSLSSDEVLRSTQMEQAREIIGRRVDTFGVAEPLIRIKGEDRIEVQMPGVSTRDNPDIIETIGKPARLEFCLVHRTLSPQSGATTPPNYRLLVEERDDPRSGEIIEVPYFVKSIPEMTGSSIAEANAAINPYGGNLVSMEFTAEGARRFADLTTRIAEENARTGTTGQLAIVLDGRLQSAPTVREPITGGSAQITGNFTQREAMDLANVLENPLEVGLEVDEMNEVGSTLAAGSRDASLMAAIVGAALVIGFMVVYYWFSGAIAITAVFFNVLFVVAGLCYFGATMTLPGVAGLVLTIGMAVDAHILILERAREELLAGKNNETALKMGYDKAFSTIVDANLTTLITSGLMAWLGTGPVKGFGVTLTIGIFGTLISALVVSHWMMDLAIGKNLYKHLVGFEMFGRRNIQFLNYAKPAFIGSWLLVCIGVFAVFSHRGNILGVDFTGGDEVTMHYTSQITIEDIDAAALTDAGRLGQFASLVPSGNDPLKQSYAAVLSQGAFGEVSSAFKTTIGTDQHTLTVQTRPHMGPAFADTLMQLHPDAGFSVASVSQIGPSVGTEVAHSALISLFAAIVGIGLYVALRFEWGFGIGAVVSTIHDGIMTIGMFVILGNWFGIGTGQFTAPMIAAILMVLGYSINDTIVVFDRIREELKLHPEMNLKELIHMAINRTLSRTILTSFTTFLSTLGLYIFAAGVVVDFALIFMIGIVVGTFSSIFIASPVFYWYHKGDRRKVEALEEQVVYEWDAGSEQK
jgi:SecD/SecF fusion protein